MRLALLVATVLGLAVAAWTIGSVGLAAVLAAALRVGPLGFLLLCAWQIVTLGLLGLAWQVAAAGLPWSRLPLLVWGRAVRDAAADILPFAQIGGLVLGARTVTAAGVAAGTAYGALLVDMVAEMAAQLVFTLVGLLLLREQLDRFSGGIERAALIGAGLVLVCMVGFAFSQRPLLRLAGRLAERMLPGAAVATEEVRGEIARIYHDLRAVAGSFLLNLLAWVATGLSAWLALALMGVRAPATAILTIESLVFVLRSVAFMVPGAIGVQEAAYLLLGPLFGLDPAAVLALSLVKRARDLAIGVPVLLLWQAGETRRLRRETRCQRAS